MVVDGSDIEPIWMVLETHASPEGLTVSSAGSEVSAGPLLAGVDAFNHRHLLIPLSSGEAARVDTRGRAVHLTRTTVDGTNYLGIACLLPEVFGVFTQFINELLQSIGSATSPARSAADLFDRWRTLFSEATASRISEEALVGLLGELETIRLLLRAGAPPDLGAWTGPAGAVHDFQTPGWALEVKSTLIREGRIVGISSLDQLDAQTQVRIWLVHHQYSRSPTGKNLHEVLDTIWSAGGSRDSIARGLKRVGVDVDNLVEYRESRYTLVSSRVYDVRGAHFPRLTRASFVDGDTPAGILRVTYSIDLTNEPPTPLPSGDIEDGFAAMGKDVPDGLDS